MAGDAIIGAYSVDAARKVSEAIQLEVRGIFYVSIVNVLHI